MSAKRPGIRLGCAGWSYKDWDGAFYPEGLPAAKQLSYYAEHFDCAEVDSTFYAIPAERMVEGWRAKTPEGFVFCPKFPKVVTHEKRLVEAEGEAVLFVMRLGLLGEKLGPMLIQLPPSFQATQFDRVAAFLDALPQAGGRRRFEYAIELRHPSWDTEETAAMLRERGVGRATVVTDQKFGEAAVEATADFGYVRFLGRRDRISRFHEVQIDRSREHAEWAQAIRNLARATGRVFVFFNNHWEGHSPASVIAMRGLLAGL